MARILDSYIDLRGNPITSCTVITNPRRDWNVDPRDFNKIPMASEMLGLSVLSAQRFFEPLAPYVNAAAFRPVIQGVDLKSDQISLLMRRRGLSLQTGGPGLTYRSVRFQCPESLYLAESPPPERQMVRALDRARTTKPAVFARIKAALPLWLLANSDEPSLTVGAELTLAAAAFEQLFGPFPNKVALRLSGELTKLLGRFGAVTVQQSRRRPDPHPEWRGQQASWWLHRKWIKELYELRSEQMHGHVSRDLSRNWKPEQHQMVAAFVFPFAVKLLLEKEGIYTFSHRELGACHALDKLLNANGWRSNWSDILSTEEARAELAYSIREAARTNLPSRSSA